MDHVKITALKLDSHHLKLLAIGINAKEDDADRSLPKSHLGQLLEADTVVGDDMADAVL
ncbi:MAG TPA: hypothetical protein VIJ50_11150 [Solirubrobacteraceae bacterium]